MGRKSAKSSWANNWSCSRTMALLPSPTSLLNVSMTRFRNCCDVSESDSVSSGDTFHMATIKPACPTMSAWWNPPTRAMSSRMASFGVSGVTILCSQLCIWTECSAATCLLISSQRLPSSRSSSPMAAGDTIRPAFTRKWAVVERQSNEQSVWATRRERAGPIERCCCRGGSLTCRGLVCAVQQCMIQRPTPCHARTWARGVMRQLLSAIHRIPPPIPRAGGRMQNTQQGNISRTDCSVEQRVVSNYQRQVRR